MFTGQFQWVLQWSPSDLPDLLFLTLLFLAFPSVLWDPLHSSGKFPRGSSVAYTQENLTDRIWTLTGVCIYKHKFSNIVFIYYAYSSAACIFLTHVSNKKHLLIGAQSWCLFSIILFLLSTRPAQWPEAFCDYPSLQDGALPSPLNSQSNCLLLTWQLLPCFLCVWAQDVKENDILLWWHVSRLDTHTLALSFECPWSHCLIQ